MLFKNVKTGNILEVTDKTTITLMTKQPDTYTPIKGKSAAKDKPAEDKPKNDK